VQGRFFRARTLLSWLLLAVMFVGPFVRINGNPLLLVNIVERKFVILGQIFWPQDMIMFAVALLVFITGIIIFTAAYGRLWCGWTCPQTVLMEMVFRKIEYLIEGDSHQQRALDKAPWTATKIVKKAGKHAIFFGLSFLIGNTLAGLHHRHRTVIPNRDRHPGEPPAGAHRHAPVYAGVLRHLRPVPRAGLHVHLSLRPAAIHFAG